MLIAPTSWSLIVRGCGEATYVRLTGRSLYLHEADAQHLRGCLSSLADKAGNGHLFLELANVQFLTSSTVEALLAVRRRMHTQGGRLSICNPTSVVAEIFTALKLDRVLDIRHGPIGEPLDD